MVDRWQTRWSAVEWELGTVPDIEIARRMGVTVQAVHRARKRRGIPCYRGPLPQRGRPRRDRGGGTMIEQDARELIALVKRVAGREAIVVRECTVRTRAAAVRVHYAGRVGAWHYATELKARDSAGRRIYLLNPVTKTQDVVHVVRGGVGWQERAAKALVNLAICGNLGGI